MCVCFAFFPEATIVASCRLPFLLCGLQTLKKHLAFGKAVGAIRCSGRVCARAWGWLNAQRTILIERSAFNMFLVKLVVWGDPLGPCTDTDKVLVGKFYPQNMLNPQGLSRRLWWSLRYKLFEHVAAWLLHLFGAALPVVTVEEPFVAWSAMTFFLEIFVLGMVRFPALLFWLW